MNERGPLSIEQQAFLIDEIVRRCKVRDGRIAEETALLLTRQDVLDLDALATRLSRMAPHEEKIKRVVTGK